MKTWDFPYWTKVQYTALSLFARRTSDKKQGRVARVVFRVSGFRCQVRRNECGRSVISERCAVSSEEIFRSC